MKRYLIEELEQFIPITLDRLVEGRSVPFEVFTDDGEFKKSLFDKGFIYNVFAKEIIYHQGLTRFYIKSANNLNFLEYLDNADKLSKIVKDDSALFIDYSEYKRENIYIDKTLLSPRVELDFPIGGMRYPIYGGIPLLSGHLNEQLIDFLMGLKADLVIKDRDIEKYERYLNRVMEVEEGRCTERPIIRIRQELLRCRLIKFLNNYKDETVLEGLLKELRDFLDLILQFSKSPLYGLKDLIDIRNVDTRVSIHSINVCIIAVTVGIRLRMSEKMLFHLAAGALLHDIGKIMIAYSVINKQGDLSMDEYTLYCSHVVEGANLVKSLTGVPQCVYEIVLQHHERLDGSGYTQNLLAKDIDLLSQIVTVADSYDALVTSTPKRKGLSQAETMRILWEDAESRHNINRTAVRALNSVLKE